MFLLDMLDNLPRLRLSGEHMKAIIFAMKEAGVPDVPSLETLRRTQKKLRSQYSVPSTRRESSRGNIYYVNDICSQVAKVNIISITIFYVSTNRLYKYSGLRQSLYPAASPFISRKDVWENQRSLAGVEVVERT